MKEIIDKLDFVKITNFYSTKVSVKVIRRQVTDLEKILAKDIPDKGFPGGASGKEPACQCRRLKRGGFDPWVGKIPWKRRRHPTPPQDSCLENPMDRGAWWATVQAVTKSQTQLR